MPVADFWLSLTRFIYTLTPSLAAGFFAGVQEIRDHIPEGEVSRLILAGNVTGAVALIISTDTVRSAFVEFRDAIRDAVGKSSLRFVRDVPVSRVGGRLLKVEFDVLDKRTVAGLLTFEKAIRERTGRGLSDAVREAVEHGLREGTNPRTIARGIRDVVGLTKDQSVWVRNFRDELVRGDPRIFGRELLDLRHAKTIKSAFAGNGLSAEQITKFTDSYRKRMIAHHAETVSRSVAISAMKEGQLAIWQQAVDQGVINAQDTVEVWRTRLDGREREEHRVMNGAVIPFGGRWNVPSVGLVRYPGEHEHNCRCVPIIRVIKRQRSSDAA